MRVVHTISVRLAFQIKVLIAKYMDAPKNTKNITVKCAKMQTAIIMPKIALNPLSPITEHLPMYLPLSKQEASSPVKKEILEKEYISQMINSLHNKFLKIELF